MPTDAEPGVPTSWAPSEHVIFTELDGDEAVLVDLNSKQYYQLNATASFIWRGLARGVGAGEIARALTEEYDVTLERALTSVDVALGRFKANRLLTAR